MIQFGIDTILKQHPAWRTKSIALVTNSAATTYDGVPSRKALLDNGFNIIKLFSPEHGLDVQGADGAFIHDGIDTLTQLPIISLYGTKLQPTEEDLAGVDIVLFDIPDTGVRFYTYLWTMTYILEAAAVHKVPLIILDRPNPISGNLEMAEGPLLDTACSSFVGRWNIPVRHCCTLGELANYFNTTRSIGVNLSIIRCTNVHRNMLHPDWGLPFVATSPAIQSFAAMQLYPGLCFLEATNLHEGRGTNYSFQTVAAPWLAVDLLQHQLTTMFMDEISCTTISFVSGEAKYKGELCRGIHFSVLNDALFKPVFFGLLVLKLIKDLHPKEFGWSDYKTNANPSGGDHLDKLTGIKNSTLLFDKPLHSFLKEITERTRVKEWDEEIKQYLLY